MSKQITVLGAGTMGRGIAQLCGQRGIEVRLYDPDKTALEKAVVAVETQLKRMVKKSKISADDSASARKRITIGSDLALSVEGSEIIIEAAPESMDLKVELFSAILPKASERALLASNTSSLSITELGQRIGEKERVIGLHFFNPPPVMPLLEIVRGIDTSESSVKQALALAKELEKEPIVVRDMPGFASSRLGVALGAEAIRMLESGVASAVDIDRAMELGYRHPMGPLKLTDLVGLDVRLAILEHLHREIGEQFRPPALLRQMVRAGRLGKKSGLGFYRWTQDGPKPA